MGTEALFPSARPKSLHPPVFTVRLGNGMLRETGDPVQRLMAA